jgi:hypothetical protein
MKGSITTKPRIDVTLRALANQRQATRGRSNRNKPQGAGYMSAAVQSARWYKYTSWISHGRTASQKAGPKQAYSYVRTPSGQHGEIISPGGATYPPIPSQSGLAAGRTAPRTPGPATLHVCLPVPHTPFSAARPLPQLLTPTGGPGARSRITWSHIPACIIRPHTEEQCVLSHGATFDAVAVMSWRAPPASD